MMYAFNQGDKFRLAIVLVGEGETVEGPHYIRNPFGSLRISSIRINPTVRPMGRIPLCPSQCSLHRGESISQRADVIRKK
jgi:hypothetical protein